MLLDKDIKKKSLEIKKKISKDFKKKNNPLKKNDFDIWKVVTKEFADNLDKDEFVTGNNAWGANMFRNHQYFYKKFFDEFGGSKLGSKNELIFTKKIFKLLNESKNKTPQKINKVRKLPFKQWSSGSHEHALPGYETIYSDDHKSNNHYYYSFCNKTKIDFFKGNKDQEQQILKNKWDKTFSHSFIYGYLQASISAILKLGIYEFIAEDLDEEFPDRKATFMKLKERENHYNDDFIKDFIETFYQKYFKIDKNSANKIFNNIEQSVYKSNLSKLLYYKNENYFTYNRKEFISDEDDGIADYINEIDSKKTKYLGSTKNKRFLKVIFDTRKDTRIKKISPNTLSSGDGAIISYEQFRLYTLSLPFYQPFDDKSLGIDEKDIFIRYAINMGVQEILFFIMEKIFSPTYTIDR